MDGVAGSILRRKKRKRLTTCRNCSSLACENGSCCTLPAFGKWPTWRCAGGIAGLAREFTFSRPLAPWCAAVAEVDKPPPKTGDRWETWPSSLLLAKVREREEERGLRLSGSDHECEWQTDSIGKASLPFLS